MVQGRKVAGGVLVVLFLLPLLCTSRSWRDSNDMARELEHELDLFQKRIYDAYKATSCSELSREADDWISKTNVELGECLHRESIANWNYVTNMTNENAQKLEKVMGEIDDWMYIQNEKARKFLANANDICNKTTLRLLHLLTQFSAVPVPKNTKTRRTITRLAEEMQAIYATSTVERNGTVYRLNPELMAIMSTSRDEAELLWAWSAWHNTTGRKLKTLYPEFVDVMNEAARDNGHADIGIYWQMVDYDETDIEQTMDKLYAELLPFYEQLHAYVRKRLRSVYKSVGSKGTIPAHLLGNMWAQEWEEIFDLVAPFPNTSTNHDVTKALIDQKYTPHRIFRLAEAFFESIGLEPMTQDFWDYSVLARPKDNRQIECHASAEEFFGQTDFRIKMCTELTSSDLQTAHHEMGHVEYYMAYRNQPTLFRTGANAAFHEAIGDTIALSVMTDTHLAAIGLIPSSTMDQLTPTQVHEQGINFLMRMALKKLSFIPFGYIIDKWRYMVFRGDVKPDEYTATWWQLREKFEGIAPPLSRSSEEFDPGAKYHVPANVPYSRYFFSFIGQFQFQETLCQLAGHKGPLHTCDIYRSKAAGDRLRSVLRLGASRPWPDVLEMFTGEREFQARAFLKYFQPLIDWLKKENSGETIGWGRGEDEEA
jgi:peptidyl-dipeptidase A